MTVALLGTGLVGGSIGLALTKAGVAVRGYDAAPEVAARAAEHRRDRRGRATRWPTPCAAPTS